MPPRIPMPPNYPLAPGCKPIALPYRLEHHEPIPGSVVVPANIIGAFNSRIVRKAFGCWLYTPHNRRSPDPDFDPTTRHYVLPFWVDGREYRIPAHRLALIQEIGPIPVDRMACHRCSKPACMNPRHLYAGTDAENQADRRRREAAIARVGRNIYSVPMRRLTCDQVAA